MRVWIKKNGNVIGWVRYKTTTDMQKDIDQIRELGAMWK